MRRRNMPDAGTIAGGIGGNGHGGALFDADDYAFLGGEAASAPAVRLESSVDAPGPSSPVHARGNGSDADADAALERGREALRELTRQRMRIVREDDVAEPPTWTTEDVPATAYEESAQVPAPEEREEYEERKVGAAEPMSRLVDFAALAQTRAPEFLWYVPGWLSPHPTLMSGRGGMGKSLAALQLAVALSAGKQFLGRASEPLRVVLWSCEEDLQELHRRLERICEYYEVPLADLGERLTIDCRHGLESTLLTSEYGRPMWTPLTEHLRQQVNDLRCDVWIGDNIAHLYACSENERHPVTVFTSWLSGLRSEAWCPLLLGHVAKVGGSEYSGSTAWENAVRMRWYLGDKLPEEQTEDESEDDASNVRFLCKRKTNYDRQDYVRFVMKDGILVPEQLEEGVSGLEAGIRARKARDVVLAGLRKLTEMGINTSERGSQTYLPRLILQYKLAQGCSPKELGAALRELMVEGTIRRGETGRDSSRRPREGLILAKRDKERT